MSASDALTSPVTLDQPHPAVILHSHQQQEIQ